MKTDQEKADEIRRKRELARKGLAEHKDEGADPIEEQEEREQKVAENGLVGGLAIKRSG